MAITRAQQYRQMLKDGKVAMQGGVKNYLGKKKTVTVPKDWQSSPDHPTTELAYITKAEKDLLIKKDLHNSLNGKPNRGPSGVMSLNGWGDRDRGTSDASYGGGNATGSGDNEDRGSRNTLSNEDRKEYDANRRAREKDPYFGTSLEGSGVTPTTSIATKEQEKQAKKEARKFTREAKKKDTARRKSKLNAILNKQKTYNTFKIDPKTGKLVVDQTIDLPGQGELQEDGTITGANPFGINEKEYQDLISSLPSYKGPPETPEQRQERINDYLAKNISSTNLDDPLNQLMEKNDRFSGVNLEAFQNEFNLPKTGLTSLDVALGFAEPFLQKGAKKNREFFSGDADNQFKYDGLFGDRNSVLSAGKYKYNGMDISPEQFAMLDPALMDDVYKDYSDRRRAGEIDAIGNVILPKEGGRESPVSDPCLGPNPPAYCNINNTPADPGTTTPSRNLGGLAPRFAGSIFDFTGLADGGRAGAMDGGRMMMMANQEEDDPTGGIMDLESGRQMYFLGKLVKKATRAVKKVAKSPVGKAALLYFGGKALMGGMKGSSFFANLKGNLLGQAGSRVGQSFVPFKEGILAKLGLTQGGGSFMPTIKGGILAASALPLLMGQKEEEDNNDDYYKTNRLNIADIRNNPYNFLSARNQGSMYAADGGLMRTGYAEGSEEPVAKKTMPLLDMDGQEMDLREEGGFVPLGRMERADDVPARLSKNEFVFTADAVRNAGEGDVDKGAEVMYNMMKNLESGGEVSEESQGLEGAREMFKTSQRLEEVI